MTGSGIVSCDEGGLGAEPWDVTRDPGRTTRVPCIRSHDAEDKIRKEQYMYRSGNGIPF